MPNVLLIPTELERRIVLACLGHRLADLVQPKSTSPSPSPASWVVEKCGFGLIAAAASTANVIAAHRPRQVVLLGIAGTYHDSIAVGSACCFDRVTCHGIGVGSSLDSHHLSAEDLGWAHCDASECHAAISDTIELPYLSRCPSGGEVPEQPGRHLLSVTTASSDESEAAFRRHHFPDADVEDMEGFAVALACAVAKVPLRIIRGISNHAGDRRHENWSVKPALRAAAELAIKVMGVSE
jgi:futalosine hydrolase